MTRSRALALTTITITLILAAVILLLRRPTEPASPVVTGNTAVEALARTENRRLSELPAQALAQPGELPASLSGVHHGIVLHTDARGHLVIDANLLRLADFFLSALGEEDIRQVLARIHYDLATQLQEPALAEARDIVRRYVDYKLDLARIDTPAPAHGEAAYVQSLGERLERMQQLRLTYFSPAEIQAFFGLEDAEDDYMKQKLAIARNTRSSPLEKQQQTAALEASLPEELRAMRARVSRDSDVYAETKQMKTDGATAEALYQYRARELGEDAARNLARLDEEQAAWQRRLDEFSAQRQQLLASGMSPQDQQAQLQTYLESHFDNLEQKRVMALRGAP